MQPAWSTTRIYDKDTQQLHPVVLRAHSLVVLFQYSSPVAVLALPYEIRWLA
jgi:hypothetical protein